VSSLLWAAGLPQRHDWRVPCSSSGSRRLAVGSIAALALLVVVPPALAHRGSPASVASTYEARSLVVQPPVAGLTARATGGDIDLVLHVPSGRDVVVLGVEGEPFLRFAGGRVFANERSPTAAAERVMRLTGDLTTGPPRWHELRRGQTFHWHEGRLRPQPSTRTGPVARIAIPLRIDGAPATVVGESWHARSPSPALWLAPLVAVLVAGAAMLRRRARVGPRLVRVLALVAVVSVLGSSIGTTLDAPHSTLGAGVQIGLAALVSAGALAGLVIARPSQRAFIALGAGALCVLFAASAITLLTDGFALSRLPTDVARGLEAVALASGALLALAGGLQLFELTTRLESQARYG
jgi:hypothetical protein